MKSFTTLFFALMASTSFAHMEMSDPPPFRGKTNKLATNIDYSMTAPLSNTGSDFPCKGYLADLGTPAGGSVVTWAAGSSQTFTIVGGASHGGGSCQALLSMDAGKTFKVIHSYIGNCPLVPDFPFTVPSDTPAGAAVFAWSWFNRVGNREMYMNCASVTIGAGSGGGSESVPFASRPNMFVANVGNGCSTLESTDTKFPAPGPDVSDDSSSTSAPAGSCGASGSSASIPGSGVTGQGQGSGSGAQPPPSAPASQDPTTLATAAAAASATAAPAAAQNQTSGALAASADGECGGPQTCTGSAFGACCSKFGYCGDTAEHCGDGCSSAFGTCGSGGAAAQALSSGPAAHASAAAPPSVTSSFLDGSALASASVFASPEPLASGLALGNGTANGTAANATAANAAQIVVVTSTSIVYSTSIILLTQSAAGLPPLPALSSAGPPTLPHNATALAASQFSLQPAPSTLATVTRALTTAAPAQAASVDGTASPRPSAAAGRPNEGGIEGAGVAVVPVPRAPRRRV